MQDKNQEILIIIVIGGIIALLLVGFVITTLFLYQRRQHKQEKELSRLREAFNQELLSSQIEIQENTMRLIGEELHDNVKQQLVFVSRSLSTLAYTTSSEEDKNVLSTTGVFIDKAISDIQHLSNTLHTERIAEEGLIPTIKSEVANINRLGFLNVTYDSDLYYNYFDGQTTIFLYRMLQESLQNILKHAQATHVNIKVYCSDAHTFVIEIQDNGKGFNLAEEKAKKDKSGGVGVKSMMNRANLIGATITIDSAIGKGTTVKITIPIPDEDTLLNE
ncbi:sensor histidine kinase [Parasediminibacterium paludis]|uniref:histidine kinase n=1 Tax=Parasediminibacterium paludis TaxID=908966 RepID=A0ABV8Q2S8_9BACT